MVGAGCSESILARAVNERRKRVAASRKEGSMLARTSSLSAFYDGAALLSRVRFPVVQKESDPSRCNDEGSKNIGPFRD